MSTAAGSRRTWSGKAAASAVLAVLSVYLWIAAGWFGLAASILCVALAGLAVRDINRSDGRLRGRWLAVGTILIQVLAFPLFVLLMQLCNMFEEGVIGGMSLMNLKQLAFAMYGYHDVHKVMPPQTVYSKDGK